MTVSELIKELSRMPQDKRVILFDENSIPYEVERVVHDESQFFDHIVLKPLDE